MYAIIKTGGKQLKVEEGQSVYVEKLNAAEGEKVTFDQVLLLVVNQQRLVLQSLKVLQLQVLLKNKASKRRLLLSSTRLRRVNTLRRVIVNHIQRLRLIQSTLSQLEG